MTWQYSLRHLTRKRADRRKSGLALAARPKLGAHAHDSQTVRAVTLREARGLPNIWDEAFDKLKQEHEALAIQFKDVLTCKGSACTGSHSGKPDLTIGGVSAHLLLAVAQDQFEYAEAKQKSKVLDTYETVLKVIISGKDFIAQVASQDPHASLAWAGVSLLLPLLLNPYTQEEAFTTGVEVTTDILDRHKVYNEFLDWPKNESLRRQVVVLYSEILLLYARGVCQYYRNGVLRYVRDVLRIDDWRKSVDRIREIDARCTDRLDAIRGQAQAHEFRGLVATNRELERLIRAEAQRNLDARSRTCLQTLACDFAYQKDVNPSRIPRTGEWLLNHSKFCQWQENETSAVLWVSAGPGCGKSVLAKSLIDERLLQCSPDTHVCYFFFKNTSQSFRRATTAVSSLLYQLFRSNNTLVEHALAECESLGPRLSSTEDSLLQILDRVLSDKRVGEIIWVLDAVDECDIDGRDLLIDVLRRMTDSDRLMSGGNTKFKCFITGRPYVELGREFTQLIDRHDLIELKGDKESAEIAREIEQVIRVRVPELAHKLRIDKDTENVLLESLLRVDNKTYLWQHLILHDIEHRKGKGPMTAKRMRDILSRMPQSVYEAYEAILTRNIGPAERADTEKILRIVSSAKEPMTVSALNVVFSMDGTEESEEDIDTEPDERFEDTARNLCGLLITVINKHVHLIHQSALEFLLARRGAPKEAPTNPDSSLVSWRHTLDRPTSDTMMSARCLKYLILVNQRCQISVDGKVTWFESMSTAEREERYRRHPFLHYATGGWIYHTMGPAFRENKALLDQFLTEETQFHACESCMKLMHEDMTEALEEFG